MKNIEESVKEKTINWFRLIEQRAINLVKSLKSDKSYQEHFENDLHNVSANESENQALISEDNESSGCKDFSINNIFVT